MTDVHICAGEGRRIHFACVGSLCLERGAECSQCGQADDRPCLRSACLWRAAPSGPPRGRCAALPGGAASRQCERETQPRPQALVEGLGFGDVRGRVYGGQRAISLYFGAAVPGEIFRNLACRYGGKARFEAATTCRFLLEAPPQSSDSRSSAGHDRIEEMFGPKSRSARRTVPCTRSLGG